MTANTIEERVALLEKAVESLQKQTCELHTRTIGQIVCGPGEDDYGRRCVPDLNLEELQQQMKSWLSVVDIKK